MIEILGMGEEGTAQNLLEKSSPLVRIKREKRRRIGGKILEQQSSFSNLSLTNKTLGVAGPRLRDPIVHGENIHQCQLAGPRGEKKDIIARLDLRKGRRNPPRFPS